MKKLLALILAVGIAPIAAGQVWVEVREADGETPFDGRDIIIGTKLTIIVSSDCNDYFSGGLFIAGQDRALGTLEGRDYDPNRLLYDSDSSLYGITQFIGDWTGSHFPEAGDFAWVTAWKDSEIWGFDLYTSYPYPVDSNSDSNDTVPGEWFIIDYYADEVGDCNVGFYDYSISWDDPIEYIIFSHISTPDLNLDQIVNFSDFMIFASQWNATDCSDPDWCDHTDLHHDGSVDFDDSRSFVQYWLSEL